MSDPLASLLAELEDSLWAVEGARRLALASLMLLIYEYTITLDKEIEHFWSGPWSTSRILYLLNRYLPLATLSLGVTCFYTPNPSSEFCDNAIKAGFCLTVISMVIIQGILVLRIWHIFPHSTTARCLCVGLFFICTVATFVTLGFAFADIGRAIKFPGAFTLGCAVPPPSNIWRMFVPPFVLHTVLFMFTVVRAVKAQQSPNRAPLMKRLLLDGGFFYAVVFFSVGFSGIGAMLTNEPMVNLPAIYSDFMLAITSICISRVMLSIRSLAASLSSDPEWLLNRTELTRLQWKKGAYDGELVVDVASAEGVDMEMDVARIRRDTMITIPRSPKFSRSSSKPPRLGTIDMSPFHGNASWF